MEKERSLNRPTDIQVVARAADFAARTHTHQRRKGEAAEPYFNHLAHVAAVLAAAGADANLVAAGYMHDTIEDREVTQADLVGAFSLAAADLAQVTDDKRLPKDRRKRLQVEHAPHLPPRAQILKMADKMSNRSALLTSPPADWSAQRRVDYFEWAREDVEGCRSAHAGLAGMFDELDGRREHQRNLLATDAEPLMFLNDSAERKADYTWAFQRATWFSMKSARTNARISAICRTLASRVS